MQLTLYTDYSLRVLLYVGLKGEQATVGEIAKSFKISRNHLVKVVHALSTRGYLRTTRGPRGGVTLGKDPATVRLGAFIAETEPHSDLVECFNAAENTCPIAGVCKLEKILHQARTSFFTELDRHTLEDLIRSSGSRDRRLERLGLLRP